MEITNSHQLFNADLTPIESKLRKRMNKSDLAILQSARGLLLYEAPVFDQVTQQVGELYKVNETTCSRTVVERPPQPVEQRIQQLDDACRAHLDNAAHWSSATMVNDKAKANKPKAKAVEAWAMSCWTQFYTNEAILEAGGTWDEAMMEYPVCPHSMKEIIQEV